MEGNRDEAYRCIDIALTSINVGNYDKAEKFLRKAENLYPSQRAKELLQHVSSMSGAKTDDTNRPKERKPQQPGSPKRETFSKELDYTKEQLEIVQKIKKCKDYYEVLGVTKESTDSEIKKSYKKLALQLHPDKNRSPGAAEAFKAIGNAVATLTDPRKRKEYDLFGSQDNNDSRHPSHFNHQSFHSRRNNYEYAYERGFESEVSAEELFNMFFGGFPQQRGQRFARHHHESNSQPSLAFGLILGLIMISMLSSFFTSDPLYSLSQTSKYPVHRQTSHLGISYYVKQSFAEEYQGSLARLENSVEEDFIATMKQNCYRERSYRESMIARARSFGNHYQQSQAQSLKVPSCDNLAKIGLTRYSIY